MHRIMLVDDEECVLLALQRELRRDGYEIECYTLPHDALKRAHGATFDLILSDYRMPGMDGVDLLTGIKAIQPGAVRLILSGYADLEAVLAAINEAEIYRFINKPWQARELRQTIRQALAWHDLLEENHYLANRVREQEREIARSRRMLERLEAEHPGITKVNRGPNGAILLDDGEERT